MADDEWLVFWGEKPYLTVGGLWRATAAKNCRLAVCESFRRFVGRPLSWYQQGWGWNTMLRHYCWQTEKTKTQEVLEVTSHPAQQLLPTSTHAHPKREPPRGRKKAKPDLLNLYALPQNLKNRPQPQTTDFGESPTVIHKSCRFSVRSNELSWARSKKFRWLQILVST